MLDAKGQTISRGDVVQIDPAADDRFGACFMVVTELKTWGVQGYVTVAGSLGTAYYRAESRNIVKIGAAEWVLSESKGEQKGG